jgi:tripartite-type tricarboxylate transporter receptor subunit TctC
MQRRTLLASLSLALALASAASLTAQAQTAYPQRPVKLVVPYAAGGSADIAARLVTDEWARKLGGVMVVDNRAGAGGNLGVDAVAKAAPDGYTIGLQTVSLAINPALTPKMPYDTLKDLAPIGMVASSQHVLVVTNNLPAKDVKSLIALLKAEPGKHNFASAGGGSTFHMAAELFKAQAGVPLVHIPYRGGGPALVDTNAGQQAARAGCHGWQALAADARRAHDRRGGTARLQLRDLVHGVRASGHAQSHRRQAQRRLERSARRAGRQGPHDAGRLRSHTLLPGAGTHQVGK